MEEDEVWGELWGKIERKGAVIGRRVPTCFLPLPDGHYAGIVDGYDGSKRDVNCFYVTYDAGDEQNCMEGDPARHTLE